MTRLFEFGDLGWVPSWYHVYMRRYSVFCYRVFGYFRLWIPALTGFFARTRSRSYLECCSGSGDVIGLISADLSSGLARDKQFILTDIMPLPDFVERINSGPLSAFRYVESPVDARSIPQELNYPRIFINSFHHFDPKTAASIMESAVNNGQGMIILEYARHSVLGYLAMLAGSAIVPLALPFLVRLRDLPLMILLTYVVPVFPLMCLWDGLVSCLRVYSTRDLEALLTAHGIPAEITGHTARSLLYPAGVSAITVMPTSMAATSPSRDAALEPLDA